MKENTNYPAKLLWYYKLYYAKKKKTLVFLEKKPWLIENDCILNMYSLNQEAHVESIILFMQEINKYTKSRLLHKENINKKYSVLYMK